MGGGLLQLVSYGAQDVFLTGSPQVTFFRSLYRRHTHFAIESIRTTLMEQAVPFGTTIRAEISRNGDLLSRMYLEVTLPKSGTVATSECDRWAYVRNLGHVLLERAKIEIGGQDIDTTFGRFDNLWSSLTMKSDKMAGFAQMTGMDTNPTSSDSPLELATETTYYIPINFWFSGGYGTNGGSNLGQALPLIALQYHNVVLELTIAPVEALIRKVTAQGQAADPTVAGAGFSKSPKEKLLDQLGSDVMKLYSDFVFLDTAERRRFAQTSHEYLVTQLQHIERPLQATGQNTISLPFNHPVKCLLWSLYRQKGAENTMFNPLYNGFVEPDAFPYADSGDIRHGSNNNPVAFVELKLNNQDRFEKRKGSYFSLVQPYQHAPVVPENNWVGLYSFGLDIGEFQPSGTLNLSRVDDCRLILDLKDPTNPRYLDNFQDANVANGDTIESYQGHIYAVNMNVLRVISGMGGLAFSN